MIKMARSTCPKGNCGGTSFEVEEQSPHGSNFKFYFVQCQTCGAVVGVMDYFNISYLIKKLAKSIGHPV